MARQKERDNLFSTRTIAPAANTDVPVYPMGPGAPMGSLCWCNGEVVPPAGYYFVGLYFKIAQDATTIYTKEQVMSSPDPNGVISLPGATSGVSIPWERNRHLSAACGPTGTPKPNTLHVVAKMWSGTPMNPKDESTIETTPFRGICDPNCTPLAKAAAAQPGTMSTIVKSRGDHVPSDHCGAWMLYRGLTVDGGFFGNRLMFNRDTPLRADLIEVSATNIHWSYDYGPFGGSGRHFIHRALGDVFFASVGGITWRFPDSPLNSIAIWQSIVGMPPYVVSSESREAPNLIHLDERQDVYAQVNYNDFALVSLTGTFDLWVKIIF